MAYKKNIIEIISLYKEDYILLRKEVCAQIAEATGKAIIHPFDNYNVMAGQGTIALELLEEVGVPFCFFLFSFNICATNLHILASNGAELSSQNTKSPNANY